VPDSSNRFLVGIDAGTTNVVVAFARCDGEGGEPAILPLPQLAARDEEASRSMLPAALYAPLEAEHVNDPWTTPPWAGGEYARARGAEVPGRYVASAKSWLAYAAVDRRAPILPWGSSPESDAPKISPVDATAYYLEHVRRVWNAAHPDAPLGEQEVVLTVPASFDETARELTLEAANSIGLAPRLLEEPTAAFYDWMHGVGSARVASLLREGEHETTVLVCDVGGGTTDLSLIRIARAETKAGIDVSRVAVGRHLLLGGDNMDLALAHACEAKLTSERLDPARFGQLVAACRAAKERLLGGHEDVSEVVVSIAGSGSKLVGNTLTALVTRGDVEALVVDGFFPHTSRGVEPTRARAGLVAAGLPYERDVGVTRHVASFLARHASADDAGTSVPGALLLNGGVFRAPRLAARLVETIQGRASRALRVLDHADPDLAVARGAVAYGLARHGKGIRIGGGSPRGYYVEVIRPEGRAAVCVMPRGALEGVPQVARSRSLELAVGKPARFELWASDETTGDLPGDVVAIDDERFVRLPPIVATIGTGRPGALRGPNEAIRVMLEGELSEVGTLDLSCVEAEPSPGVAPRRFRFAFALRETVPPPNPVMGSSVPAPSSRLVPSGALEAACDAIGRVFGKTRSDVGARDVKDLVRELERLLGERASWETATNRALFDALIPGRSARRRSLDHERVFWFLAGFCLRPGFGDPGDPARVALLAPLAPDRLSFPDQTRGWQQFFIAYRRVAAGMSDAQQTVLRDILDPWLAPPEARGKKPRGAKPLADPEMLDMVSSLERVLVGRRAELGAWVLERTWTARDPRLWVAVGRLGARVPAYASLDHVVAPSIVERWVEQLLREKWDKLPSAGEVVVTLARVTGDRARDLSDAVRKEVARRLTATGATDAQVRAVRELVAVDEQERAAFWGESLPVGLRLIGDAT
jgi:molecular chaperone DnaK (HSP70)